MVFPLRQTGLERLTIEIVNLLDILGYQHTSELDFNSGLVGASYGHEKPMYLFTYQVMPEARKLPITFLRISFQIGIWRNAGQSSFEQNQKIHNAQDGIWTALRNPSNQRNLGIRALQRVNDALRVQDDLFVALNEYLCQLILRKGEY